MRLTFFLVLLRHRAKSKVSTQAFGENAQLRAVCAGADVILRRGNHPDVACVSCFGEAAVWLLRFARNIKIADAAASDVAAADDVAAAAAASDVAAAAAAAAAADDVVAAAAAAAVVAADDDVDDGDAAAA